MFVNFFYALRSMGIPVTPTSFLRLQKALNMGLVNSLEDFYISARTIMVKSERYFDIYDRVFAHYFEGAELISSEDRELEEFIRNLLMDWLKDPAELALALGMTEDELKKFTPEELVNYFLERLKEQRERHNGGNYWVGTRGRSPVGHSGYHPGGMRIGGASGNKSAIKVAMERRWKDYAMDGPLDTSQIGEALKRLKHLKPVGPKDQLNIRESIYQTVKKGGEIEIVFDRRLLNKLKVILMMDNGGYSMDPYIDLCRTIFKYANDNFKEVKTYYFHNCIYDRVYEDPPRRLKPVKTAEFARMDNETRLIIVGDASMAPYELTHQYGNIEYEEYQTRSGIWWLQFLAKTFPHSVWLNPKLSEEWEYTAGSYTISRIREVFPMFDFTIDGLERAVNQLLKK